MAYKNEAAFSKALAAALKERGASVTRIETGMTSQGVPDMFVQMNGGDVWLELKNMPTLTAELAEKKGKVKIAWRPGQVGWAYQYWLRHGRKKCSLTVIAGKSEFFIVLMRALWVSSEVFASSLVKAESLESVAAAVQLAVDGRLCSMRKEEA